MSKDKVVVAMSGGVDSSLAAVLLKEEGYDVIGITMKLYMHDGGCCSFKDVQDARRVANAFGFPHHVVNYSQNFHTSVIDYFITSYENGSTPLPCVKCNQDVKFSQLLNASKALGAKFLATGHYAQIEDQYIKRGIDFNKDQSYYLFPIRRENIDDIIFPLGGYTKDKVREMSKDVGIHLHDKKDSQDICFVTHGRYTDFISKSNNQNIGDIVDLQGNVIGKHEGIIGYTIGQRRGIKIGGSSDRMYILKIISHENKIVVGSREDLAKKYIILEQFNNLGLELGTSDLKFKFRANQNLASGKIIKANSEFVVIELDDYDCTGIAKGQAGVAYYDDIMIGGGWIIDSGYRKEDIFNYI